MRDDLTAGFLAELDKHDLAPRLLVEFHFAGGTRYLSDQVIGLNQGLVNEYEPIIESWGALRDNVRLEPIVAGKSLEARQLTFSIINSGSPRFSDAFKNQSPENVEVHIYQWFENLPESDKALIDILVCQDPITTSEAASLVSINMVSPIMVNNNFVWGPNKTIDIRYPLVVGKTTVVAKDLGLAPTGNLIYDIDATQTGELFIEGDTDFISPAGFITIDSEILEYDSFDVTKFNIINRGVQGTTNRPHIRGALVCNPADVFDYTVSAGPVATIDNLQADGEDYANDFTPFPGEDPAFIRFPNRPPWHSTEAGDPGPPITPPEETSIQYGSSYEDHREVAGTVSSPANINNNSANAVIDIDSTIGGDISNAEAGADNSFGPIDADDLRPERINVLGNYSTGRIQIYDQDMTVGEKLFHASAFNRNLAGYGSFQGCDVTITLGAAFIKYYTAWFEIYVTVQGAETILYQQERNGSTAGGIYATGQPWNFDLSPYINSWSDLQNAKIGLRWVIDTVTTSPAGPRDCSITDAVVYWYPIWQDATADPTYPVRELVSHFNKNLSGLGSFRSVVAKVRFDASSNNTDVTQRVVYRITSDESNNSTLWSRAVDDTSFPMATQTLYPNINTWAQLQDARIGVRMTIDGPAAPGDRRRCTSNVAFVKWEVTYQPGDISTPDEERVVYVTELLCDVTSLEGADRTPPDAIRGLITQVGGLGSFIDQTKFDEQSALYQAEGYFFNGLIDGATRFHDALRDLLRQGLLRIIYNAGKIKVRSSFFEGESVQAMAAAPDMTFSPDQLRARAITEMRMRVDDIINRVTVQYKVNPQRDEWDGEIEKTDVASVNEIGEQHSSATYSLVRDDTIADTIATRILERVSTAKVFTTFRAYMSAFSLEKVDVALIETDFNDYAGLFGRVLTIQRIFGEPKRDRMNVFEVTFASVPISVVPIDISETVQVADSISLETVISIDKLITESVNVAENFASELVLTIQLQIADTVQVADVFSHLIGIEKTLDLADAVQLADSFSHAIVIPETLQLADSVQVADLFAETLEVTLLLNLADQVEVQALVSQIDLSTGYGTPGYGEGGYGGASAIHFVSFGVDLVIHSNDDVTHPQ